MYVCTYMNVSKCIYNQHFFFIKIHFHRIDMSFILKIFDSVDSAHVYITDTFDGSVTVWYTQVPLYYETKSVFFFQTPRSCESK